MTVHLGLFPAITVHCFYGCGHVARGVSPEAAHDEMEAHYRGCGAPSRAAVRRNLLLRPLDNA